MASERRPFFWDGGSIVGDRTSAVRFLPVVGRAATGSGCTGTSPPVDSCLETKITEYKSYQYFCLSEILNIFFLATK